MSRKPAGPGRGKTGGKNSGSSVRDWHLWSAVGKTVDPLVRRKSLDPKFLLEDMEKAASELPRAPERRAPPAFARLVTPSARPVIAAARAHAQKPIEPNLKKRVARGREPIDGTIDLHGMTQIQAQAALERFILARAARGDRTLLVITGKGIKKTGYLQLENKGVLREMVPIWLNAPKLAHWVAGIEPAHQAHGGGGALYVRLKRPRGAP